MNNQEEKLRNEIERLRNALYYLNIYHQKLYDLSNGIITQNKKKTTKRFLRMGYSGGISLRRGYLERKDILSYLSMAFNIQKEDCILIINSFEQLGFIKKENRNYKILPPKKSKEELRFEIKKKMGLLPNT